VTDNGGGAPGNRGSEEDADSWFKPSENRNRTQSEYQDPLEQEGAEEGDAPAGGAVFPDSGGYAGLSASRPAMVEPYPDALGGPPVTPPAPDSPHVPGAISYPGAGSSAYQPVTRVPGENDPLVNLGNFGASEGPESPVPTGGYPGIAASAQVPLPPEDSESPSEPAHDSWATGTSDSWARRPSTGETPAEWSTGTPAQQTWLADEPEAERPWAADAPATAGDAWTDGTPAAAGESWTADASPGVDDTWTAVAPAPAIDSWAHESSDPAADAWKPRAEDSWAPQTPAEPAAPPVDEPWTPRPAQDTWSAPAEELWKPEPVQDQPREWQGTGGLDSWSPAPDTGDTWKGAGTTEPWAEPASRPWAEQTRAPSYGVDEYDDELSPRLAPPVEETAGRSADRYDDHRAGRYDDELSQSPSYDRGRYDDELSQSPSYDRGRYDDELSQSPSYDRGRYDDELSQSPSYDRDRYDDELSPSSADAGSADHGGIGGGSGNTWAFDRDDSRLPDVVRDAERRRQESAPQEPAFTDWGADSGWDTRSTEDAEAGRDSGPDTGAMSAAVASSADPLAAIADMQSRARAKETLEQDEEFGSGAEQEWGDRPWDAPARSETAWDPAGEPSPSSWGRTPSEGDDSWGGGEGATQMFTAPSFEPRSEGRGYGEDTYADPGYDDSGRDELGYDDRGPVATGVPSDLGSVPAPDRGYDHADDRLEEDRFDGDQYADDRFTEDGDPDERDRDGERDQDPEGGSDYEDGFTPADYGMPDRPRQSRRRRDKIADDFPGFDDASDSGDYPGYDSIDFLADTEPGANVTLWLGVASLIPGLGVVTAVLALFVTGPRAKRAIRESRGTLDGLGRITAGTVFAVIGIIVTVISVGIWLAL
jgi:hypothetical protein